MSQCMSSWADGTNKENCYPALVDSTSFSTYPGQTPYEGPETYSTYDGPATYSSYDQETNKESSYAQETNLESSYVQETNMESSYVPETNMEDSYVQETIMEDGTEVNNTMNMQSSYPPTSLTSKEIPWVYGDEDGEPEENTEPQETETQDVFKQLLMA
ncbi:hypothetical protein TrCOL_g8460, partial [Triparma columacea]